MSRKANPTAIGGFVIGAVVLLTAGVMFFGGGSLFRVRETYVLNFEGSLQGLQVGAPVLFRGVKVGQVSSIVVKYRSADQTFQIPVYIELEPSRVASDGRRMRTANERRQLIGLMISRGLRAQLTMQSFVTGMLAVQLDFFPEAEARYVGGDADCFELPTIPSPIEEITKTLQQLPIEDTVADLRRTLQGVDELVRSDDVRNTFRSFDRAASDLGKLARDISDRLPAVSDSLLATLDEARRTLSTATERVAKAEEAFSAALADVRTLSGSVNDQVDPVAREIRDTAAAARSALDQARDTLRTAQAVIQPESRLYHETIQTLEELQAAAAALRQLADLLERQPEALIQGK